MSYQWECAQTLALQVPCPTCHVQAGQICKTISGAAARYTHATRSNPFMQAWYEGYESAEDDYLRWPDFFYSALRARSLDTTKESVLE